MTERAEIKWKAAIYCRLSEEDRNKISDTEDSSSIRNQRALLLQFAADQNWEVYGIYSDDDYAGADRERPAFKKLLEDAQNRKFDIVLCKTQSRFTRELELVEKYIHGYFPLWGIRFVSVVDHADTENRGNKKSRQINGLVNEWYLEDLSENIKSVLTDRRKKGYHIGSSALYGYRKDPQEKGHLLIDREAAEVVREVFLLYSQGYGKTAIARMLNDRGIPNPTEYKRLHGLRTGEGKKPCSTLWKYYNISDMLANEMYIGNMVQGKYGSISYKTKKNRPRPREQWYRVEGMHEPIIERELWERVQSLIEKRAKPFADGRVGIFTGKARCMYCGYSMRSSKSHGKHYLQCPTRYAAKDACVGSFISVEKLELAVLNELNVLCDKFLEPDLQSKNRVFDVGNEQYLEEMTKREKEACEKRITEYTTAMSQLYLDKTKGILSETDYLSFYRTFLEKRSREEKRLQELEIKSKSDCAIRGETEKVEESNHLQKLDREMTEQLIESIRIGKKNPETKELPIEIYWKF